VIHPTIVALAVLGIAAGLLVVGIAAVPRMRRVLWGYELWAAFLVAATATAGSLFFSETAHFVPCELCWFQRICMYPLAGILLLAAIANDHRAARYLWPLPLAGAGVAIYHVLVENGVVSQTRECVASAPGGCAVKWINEFGFMTIPTLALTAFVLLLQLLALASREVRHA